MTNQLIISNVSIHQDANGRYSVNDLHQAAGAKQKHKPVHWLSLQQTNDLIDEILKVENPTFKPVTVKKGRYGGTYVCKELVYSYAMWISAAFALKVIKAYDSLVTLQRQIKTTVDERTPLRDAINMLVGKKSLMYPEAYAFIHQRFNVAHIDDLASEQLPMAIEYIHRLVLEGEYIGKETLPELKEGIALDDYQLYDVYLLTQRIKWAYEIFSQYNLKEHLSGLGSPAGTRIHEHLATGCLVAKRLMKLESEFDEVQRRLGLNQYARL